MKYSGKILFGIFLVLYIILFIFNIYSDLNNSGTISSHTIVIFVCVLVSADVVIRMKTSLSKKELKKYLITAIVFCLAWFILFKLGILP